MTAKPTVLVIGPHGVTGGAVTRRLAADTDWQVITASRRGAPEGLDVEHLSVDLLAPDALSGPAHLRRVTHVVYETAVPHQLSASAAARTTAGRARHLTPSTPAR